MAIARMTRMIPVILFSVIGDALLAIRAPILAKISVNNTHMINIQISGGPSIMKCDTAPVKAVNDIMNTLVPTAVFNSYPRIDVSIISIIIPPPAPTNPHINPIKHPKLKDSMALLLGDTLSMDSLVVKIGFIINFIPTASVTKTEKFPIVPFGTRLDTKLPTAVNNNTVDIIRSPFLISILPFFLYVYAEIKLAKTSEAKAIPTAVYAGTPKKVTSIGVITAAALIPAKPVPRPAPRPARRQTNNFIIFYPQKKAFLTQKTYHLNNYTTNLEKCQEMKKKLMLNFC